MRSVKSGMQSIEKFGQLDYVIANAGVGVFKPVDEITVEDFASMIDTNLTGIFHTLKASVEDLKKSQGYFITISSLAGTNFFEKGAIGKSEFESRMQELESELKTITEKLERKK